MASVLLKPEKSGRTRTGLEMVWNGERVGGRMPRMEPPPAGRRSLSEHYLQDGDVPREALRCLVQFPALQALLHCQVAQVLVKFHGWKRKTARGKPGYVHLSHKHTEKKKKGWNKGSDLVE